METKPLNEARTQATSDASDTAAKVVQHAKHTSEAFLGAIADHADEAQRKVAAGVKTIEREVTSTVRDVKSEAAQAAEDVKSAAAGVASRARTSARAAYSEIVDIGSHLPDRAVSAGRSIDAHVRANPRMDLAIVAGASALVGAWLGKRIVPLAVVAGAAYAVTKAYPRLSATRASSSRNA